MMNAADHKNHHEAFILRLNQIVLQNLDNEQFGVSELSRHIGISRSQLHRKLKLAKRQSISQFIREVRLNEAIKLLKQEDLTVSEVAYRVGFSSSTYFHKCFHSHYGFAPGEIKKKSIDQTDSQTNENTPPPPLESINLFSRFNITVRVVLLFLALVLTITAILYFIMDYPQDRKSIAVLPLHNFTGEKDLDHVLMGFHDALIGTLGQFSNVRVISRTSTLRYKETDLSLQRIAKELGVKAIMEGSLAGSGDQKFLQLQLIEVFPKERHIWAKKYRQDLTSMRDMEKDIARCIVKELNVFTTPLEEKLISNSYPVHPESYKAYLLGMFYWNDLTEKNLNTALEYFDIALKYDPNYAPAYAGKSLVWTGRLQQGLVSYTEGVFELKSAAQKALELDSTLSEVYYALGCASCWVEWDYEKAAQQLKTALAYNPNYAYARAYLSHVLNILHQPEEAMEQINIALELDPFNPLLKALYGMNLNFAGQYDKAIGMMTKILVSDPTNAVALSTLRTTYHMKGMYPEALSIWKASYKAKEDHQALEALEVGAANGGYSGALENLAKLLIDRSDTCYVTPWQIATLYTRAGNNDKALEWLSKAYYAHDSNMPYISIDPIFYSLWDDARFKQLVKNMKLPTPKPPVSGFVKKN